MGLERIASMLQGVDNLYEIDEVKPILDRAAEMTGKKYGAHSGHAASQSHPDDVRLRVIADHVRTALMLIGDGVTPCNEGRGYVLRRILRRAIRSMRLLGWNGPALPRAAAGRARLHGAVLPGGRRRVRPDLHVRVRGGGRVPGHAALRHHDPRPAMSEAKSAGSTPLTGDQAFQLHDTYGFPIDLTLEIAAEQGLVGRRGGLPPADGRAAAPGQGRRAGAQDRPRRPVAYRSALDAGGPVEFTGYQEVERESRIRALLGDTGAVEVAGEGDEVELVLDTTPFYAEGGGQQADLGVITVGGGQVEVLDVQPPVPGLIVHKVTGDRGEVRVGESAYAEIDVNRRRAISRAHTATHLVHQTMRNVPRRVGDPGRFAQRAGPAALRLQHARGGAAERAARRRAAGQRGAAAATSRCTRSSPRRRRRAGSARWRCSARSTATRSASSRSATTRASCAAVRTCSAPASSAW